MSSPGGGKPDVTLTVGVQGNKQQAEQVGKEQAQAVNAGFQQVTSQTQQAAVGGLIAKGAGGKFQHATPEQVRAAASGLGTEESKRRRQQVKERGDSLHDQVTQRRGEYHQQVLAGQAQRSTNTQQRESTRHGILTDNLSRQRSTADSMAQDARLRNTDRAQRGRNLVNRTAASTIRAQGQIDRAPGNEQLLNASYQRRMGRFQNGQTLAGNLGMSMAQTMRSPLTGYAAVQGNFGPLLGGVGRGLFNAGLSSFQQASAYNSGMQTWLGTAGATKPPPLSALGRMAPAFGIAGAALAAGAVYAGGSSLFAGVNQSNVGLAAAMNSGGGATSLGFGPGGFGHYGTLPNSSGMYASLAGAASNFSQSTGTADQLAGQLGGQGVMSSQLNQQVQNTMALGAFSGIKPQDLNAMTGQMAVGGGMSQEQVGQAYGKLVTQQQLTGISIGKMVDSLKTLEQATNGTNISVSGLAAVTKLAGSSMTGAQMGQAVSSLMNTSGVDSLRTAAVLGVSQQQLSTMQSKGNVAGLTDAAAKRLRGLVPKGGSTASRVALAETINNSLGLFDMSTTSGASQKDFFRTMLNGAPGQFSKLAAQIQTQTGSPTAGMFRSSGSLTASDSNSIVTNTMTALQSAGNTALNAISANMAKMYQLMQGTAGNPGATPAPGGGGSGGGVGGAATMTINRSTIPGGVANSSYSFTSSQTSMIQSAAKKYGVPWQTLMAQVAREGWSPSTPGIGGPGQFEPGTAAGLIADKNSPVYGKTNFTQNYGQSMAAMAYMDRGLYKQMGGNWQNALAAYNAGPGNAGIPAAQAYGADVLQSAQTIQITGTMVLQDTAGRTIGHGTIDAARTSLGKRGAHAKAPIPGDRQRH